MNKITRAIATLFLVMAISMAATTAIAQPTQADPSMKVYFVTMVLQSLNDANTIRPVHAVVSQTSPEEAEAEFIKLVRRDFSEYKVLSTLTSPASALQPPSCVNRNSSVMFI